ncbi:DUF3515 family protein [Naumannella halotolerans]|uniref:DUF3515 family protein n=1 Tax=Naumannella halotolerans TaxID=993414 RepID=UPI00370D730D
MTPSAPALRLRRYALPALGGLLALTGCSGAVQAADPELSAEAVETCAKVMSELPETVDGQPRRDTEPGRWTAAWGKPAIVLTCGAELPASAGPDAQCFEVNGVGWYAEEAEPGWVFTTLGRTVPVQVSVPSEHSPEADALVDLAQTINDHDENVQPCV